MKIAVICMSLLFAMVLVAVGAGKRLEGIYEDSKTLKSRERVKQRALE